MQIKTKMNPLCSHHAIDNSQTEEMIIPHLLASFDSFDEIEDMLRIDEHEYDHDRSQIKSEHFEQLNGHGDIEIIHFYQDSHVTKNSIEKDDKRRSNQRKENDERSMSSLSTSLFASLEDDAVNEFRESDSFNNFRIKIYLEKERANEKNAAIEMKQTNLKWKKENELLKQQQEEQEREEHDEQCQYAKTPSLSDLFNEINVRHPMCLDDEELAGLAHKNRVNDFF